MESVVKMDSLSFYKGKNVFITGHTGFKGSWLCRILLLAGANVTGYSLDPPTKPALFDVLKLNNDVNSIIGDIRDYEKLKKSFEDSSPDIVFHLAAQPIVRDSYKMPRYTYETNVMGTVNLLECVRTSSHEIASLLNVTTDKVYVNNEWCWGYRETEPLDGFDPYSNSKSCSELVTHSYGRSFFTDTVAPSISTARAGNVIGGGDFANDRIIPDCIRAVIKSEDIIVRNPYSTRPYQHVFEPLSAYLLIAQKQAEDKAKAGQYNVGPDECDCITTGKLVELFCRKWGNVTWKNIAEANAPHEANFLKLDCSKIKSELGWSPRWHVDKAIEETCKWVKAWISNEDIIGFSDKQISDFYGKDH